MYLSQKKLYSSALPHLRDCKGNSFFQTSKYFLKIFLCSRFVSFSLISSCASRCFGLQKYELLHNPQIYLQLFHDISHKLLNTNRKNLLLIYIKLKTLICNLHLAPIETEILFWREATTSQKDWSGKREIAPKFSHKSLKETLQRIFRGQ